MTWILPGLLIAMSPKYQQWICVSGMPYLPVFVQYFGVAILFVGLLLWLSRQNWRRGSQASLALAGMFLVTSGITFDTNQHNIDVWQAHYQVPARWNMEAALQAGVADEVPAGATIITAAWRCWLFSGPPQASRLFAQHMLRKVNVVNGDPGPSCNAGLEVQLTEQSGKLPLPEFVIGEYSNDRCGYVMLAPLEWLGDGPRARRYAMRRFRLFVRGEEQLASGYGMADEVQACAYDDVATNRRLRICAPICKLSIAARIG